MAELRNKEDMNKALQSQVRGLQGHIVASSKSVEQIGDAALGESMQRIGYSLQTWVVTYFRRAKLGKSYIIFIRQL